VHRNLTLVHPLRPERNRCAPTDPVDPHRCGPRGAGLAGGRALTCAGGDGAEQDGQGDGGQSDEEGDGGEGKLIFRNFIQL
jgi:hypothetical protein